MQADGAVCQPRGVVRREEYHRRATEALRSIGALPRLGEALRWLEQTQPARHRWLTVALPAHLDMIWEAGAPLDVFQQVLARWVAGHEQAVQDHEIEAAESASDARGSHEATESHERQHGL